METTVTFDASISADDIAAFAKLSGDFNPLHVNAEYARSTEFGRPIAHGAFLIGLVSRVLGMHIPGQRSLILSMALQFPKPLYYPAAVRVEGRLKHFDPQRQTGSVLVTIVDCAKLWRVVEADVSFALHGATDPQAVPATPSEKLPVKGLSAGRHPGPRLLVTGLTGGMGSQVLPLLAQHYSILGLSRQVQSPPATSKVSYQKVDLEAAGVLDDFLRSVRPDDFYGIVHMSVAPMSRAFVSGDIEGVRRHWRHAVEVPLRLTQWAKQPGSGIKRLILIGSTAGTRFPKPEFGAYSLGKAAGEHLVRLLPYDLGAQGATVNMVIATAVPVGLNEGMPERARKSLAGKTPTGRMVEPQEIAKVIVFLLSESAAQVNGTAITVDGGMLE